MVHKIIKLAVTDVRFPTSLEQHGSDAMHRDPDYSAAYVVISTDVGLRGYGLTFTVGRGTEIDWPRERSDPPGHRCRPECSVGPVGEGGGQGGMWEDQMLKEGYPAYTTSCAWMGYSDQQLKQLCTDALNNGWTKFKMKVGADLEDDIRRCRLIRQMIGPDNTLMIDANQRWDVGEAIAWVSRLAEFRPLWIEEPTSPDDILGHAAISKALAPLGIRVATGEQCHNRVMFKQFLQASALQFVQIDSCRLGSVNENLAVLLMAHKFQVPVCPHAGGVGLCELVQHLILFDYICVSADLNNRMCEYVDHLHEHFTSPAVIRNACYMPPKDPGYSSEMLESSVHTHQYPEGDVWKTLLNK
uniref:Mitochondrial enolase superfamily member 1 n=1 Tax=Myripristis murdjan TaxID=586833 RepID=A0A667XFD9_9TELE